MTKTKEIDLWPFFFSTISLSTLLLHCHAFILVAPCDPFFALSRPMHIVRLPNIPSRLMYFFFFCVSFYFFRFFRFFACHVFYMIAPAVPSETLSERLMRSCARHRFVAASSRRTEEKVASRRGSGRH